MANRQDFESYVMACVRKYEEKNPDKIIHARKVVEIPKEKCLVCSTDNDREMIIDIPFGEKVYLSKNRLITELDDAIISTEIRYCPMCGREL